MTNGSDTAYPDNRQNSETYGLTKREYFAAMALQGSLASEAPQFTSTVATHASMAVQYADALIEALKK